MIYEIFETIDIFLMLIMTFLLIRNLNQIKKMDVMHFFNLTLPNDLKRLKKIRAMVNGKILYVKHIEKYKHTPPRSDQDGSEG